MSAYISIYIGFPSKRSGTEQEERREKQGEPTYFFFVLRDPRASDQNFEECQRVTKSWKSVFLLQLY
jgi:hypothetical protein